MKTFNIFCFFMATFMFGFIYYVSSLQFPPPPTGVSLSGKAMIYHLSVFFLLMMFFHLSLFNNGFKQRKSIFYLSMSIILVYAVLDELHQFFVPGRYSSSIDVLIDFIGILFASFTYSILEEKKLNL